MKRKDNIKILILDDEKQFTEELCGFFDKSEFEPFEANIVGDARKILQANKIDLLILDIRLPGISGLDVLREVKIDYPFMEVIIVSAHGDMETVIKAMRLGAFDYLRKPFRFLDIQIAIERTQKYIELQRRMKQIEEKNSLISKNLEEKIDRQFIGISPAIREVYDQAVTAANYPEANVLITGESGTGKENIARIIHYSSNRNDQIFCAVNSSAITETLLESEFFGHKKGSFTGAIMDKMGYFEVCNQGTLFLDEIADMPLNLQAKILRAIEEKVITRVGDTNQIKTDFRVISATNHDIEKRIDKNRFRLDLLHRLNTLHIHIPPLRERPEDIVPLLNHFIEYYSSIFNKPNLKVTEEVYDLLKRYDFPGNVREMKNLAERAVILCKGSTLGISSFPVKQQKNSLPEESSETFNLKIQEIKIIRKVLQVCRYNQQNAADLLGIHRDALGRKMKKYDILNDDVAK